MEEHSGGGNGVEHYSQFYFPNTLKFLIIPGHRNPQIPHIFPDLYFPPYPCHSTRIPFGMPNFRRIAPTWCSTVLSERPRVLAIAS